MPISPINVGLWDVIEALNSEAPSKNPVANPNAPDSRRDLIVFICLG